MKEVALINKDLRSNVTVASFEANMVFKHLFKNNEVYSVTKNNSGLLFISKKLDIQSVKIIVEKYLKDVEKGNYAIDGNLKRKKELRDFI